MAFLEGLFGRNRKIKTETTAEPSLKQPATPPTPIDSSGNQAAEAAFAESDLGKEVEAALERDAQERARIAASRQVETTPWSQKDLSNKSQIIGEPIPPQPKKIIPGQLLRAIENEEMAKQEPTKPKETKSFHEAKLAKYKAPGWSDMEDEVRQVFRGSLARNKD